MGDFPRFRVWGDFPPFRPSAIPRFRGDPKMRNGGKSSQILKRGWVFFRHSAFRIMGDFPRFRVLGFMVIFRRSVLPPFHVLGSPLYHARRLEVWSFYPPLASRSLLRKFRTGEATERCHRFRIFQVKWCLNAR